MKAVCFLVVWCLPFVCCGFRFRNRTQPEALKPWKPSEPLKPPIGRHIQWTVGSCCAGLADRMVQFNWFMALAQWNNATLHVLGGWKGADQYLSGKHSPTVNTDWSHYLSVAPGCGQGPFHDAEPFEGCQDVAQNFLWSKPFLFSGANGCVNMRNVFTYRWWRTLLAPRGPLCYVDYSQQVQILDGPGRCSDCDGVFEIAGQAPC